jgi:hypothetical protein
MIRSRSSKSSSQRSGTNCAPNRAPSIAPQMQPTVSASPPKFTTRISASSGPSEIDSVSTNAATRNASTARMANSSPNSHSLTNDRQKCLVGGTQLFARHIGALIQTRARRRVRRKTSSTCYENSHRSIAVSVTERNKSRISRIVAGGASSLNRRCTQRT